MVKVWRRGAVTVATALLLTATACGDAKNRPAETRSSAPASSSPTATTSASSGVSSGVSASRPGRLYVVPADTLATSCGKRLPLGVACDAAGKAYRFQPQALRRVAVVHAEAEQGQAGWVVEVDLDSAGRRTMTTVTSTAARTHEFVLLMPAKGGPVITAAQVTAPITGGKVQISGTGSRASAQHVVNQITRTAR